MTTRGYTLLSYVNKIPGLREMTTLISIDQISPDIQQHPGRYYIGTDS